MVLILEKKTFCYFELQDFICFFNLNFGIWIYLILLIMLTIVLFRNQKFSS